MSKRHVLATFGLTVILAGGIAGGAQAATTPKPTTPAATNPHYTCLVARHGMVPDSTVWDKLITEGWAVDPSGHPDELLSPACPIAFPIHPAPSAHDSSPKVSDGSDNSATYADGYTWNPNTSKFVKGK